MSLFSNFCGHLSTITRHRHRVILHCFKAGIGFQGLFHDLSKYSPEELTEGIRYYQNGKRSPNEGARAANGYSRAWMHHKGRNKHHFEYWTDYNPKTRALEPVEMPLRYNIEMVCDRIAASKIYGGKDYHNAYALEYFNKGRARGFMHPKTAELTGQLLTMLSEQGEKATFSYIRGLLREERRKCQRTR